jgi:DNA-binding PucR family transcriptional regulator
MKSPLALVKEKFGEKSKLVEAVKALATEELWLGRTSADRGRDRGLEHVSNAKLLRLHAVLSTVKEKFGTRAKLIDEVLAVENRSKDGGLRKRLEAYPVPRLYDLYKAGKKRAGAATKA